jgi:hypothetical protein
VRTGAACLPACLGTLPITYMMLNELFLMDAMLNEARMDWSIARDIWTWLHGFWGAVERHPTSGTMDLKR